MSSTRLDLPVQIRQQDKSYIERLTNLLIHEDLDFHTQVSGYTSHNFHSFPAKFPPQLPRLFILNLTKAGDIVLDPMQGSGTTLLEANLAGRRAIGFDIDPLSALISGVKITPLDPILIAQLGNEIKKKAHKAVKERSNEILIGIKQRWDQHTREFIDNWFDLDTQVELMALVVEIEKIENISTRRFFELALSAIIITKSGGVSLARDLAHTRPHRARLIYSQTGEILEGADLLDAPPRNLEHLTKKLKSAIDEFDKRVQNNLAGLLQPNELATTADVALGDAQNLPLPTAAIDLIVTSPPYASNAIDYMRAHKFSLTWLGYPIGDLSIKRKAYIGGEVITEFAFEDLPTHASKIVADVTKLDAKKGKILHRYYSEMSLVLREMYRVLKPGKAAIVVVGNSEMRGLDTETQNCLAEIGQMHGFRVPAIGVRNLDRNRRMLPAGGEIDRQSQIQKRMYEEFVIGLYKSEMGERE